VKCCSNSTTLKFFPPFILLHLEKCFDEKILSGQQMCRIFFQKKKINVEVWHSG